MIDRSLEDHEENMPHKNRTRVLANGFPKSAVAFGLIPETCATCHWKFRDSEKALFQAQETAGAFRST